MFSRLAFAVAINIEPDIIILDEILAVGDVLFQNKCFKKMKELKQQGTTILFVSHDIASVKLLCSRCIWLKDGKQYMDGDVQEVCAAYYQAVIEHNNDLSRDAVIRKESAHVTTSKTSLDSIQLPALNNGAVGRNQLDVIIKSFFFEDTMGNQTEILEAEQDYKAVMAVEFQGSMEKIIYGFVLDTVKGVTVLGLNTYMSTDGRQITVKENGVEVVTFRFRLPKISRGTYLVSPAVAQGTHDEHIILTWLENARVIEIINDGYNASLIELDNQVEFQHYNLNAVSYT